MSTVNERVKELRKTLGLTLEKFGARLGVKKNAISRIETGKSKLTNQMFIAICREYRVNPEWLRDGKGDMFSDMSKESEYWDAVERLKKDSFFVNMAIRYARLSEDERITVRKCFGEFGNAAEQVGREEE